MYMLIQCVTEVAYIQISNSRRCPLIFDCLKKTAKRNGRTNYERRNRNQVKFTIIDILENRKNIFLNN